MTHLASLFSSLVHASTILPNSSSTTNTSIPCDLRLFEMEYLSTRPSMNSSNYAGFCPDSIFVPIVAWTEIAIFLPIITFTLIGVIWKRKSGHIQARNLSTLIPIIIASFFSTVLPSLRWGIGRDVFPCGLLILTLYNTSWAMVLPPLLNIFSFIIRHMLYKLLTGNIKDLREFDRTSLKVETIEVASTIEEMQQVIDLAIRNTPSVHSINTMQSTDTITDIQNSKSNELASHSGTLDFTPRQVKLYKFYKFLLSAKFRILTYLVCLGFHVSLWLIMGLAQLTNESAVSEYYNTGINNFVGGCVVHSGDVLMFCVFFIYYLSLTFVLLVVSFFLEKDTWGIKTETLTVSILLFVAVISYLVCPYITVIRTFTDYFFPFGQPMVIYSIVQPIIFVTIPVCRSIYNDKYSIRETVPSSKFEKILLKKETFKIALDFSRRSYCSEPVMCFDSIENYMKARRKSSKYKIAKHILNTYLSVGSLLELNIDKIEDRFASLDSYITSCDDKKIDEEMEFLRNHCLQDMSEMMYRLILSDKKIKDMVFSLTPVEKFPSPTCQISQV